jgi:hypothetical protein
MPTNANVFNSRVTSEALEAKFRQVFPAQGGAELVQDLFASGVIQPVVDFSTVAEGSVLAPNLQTAWDFSTGHNTVTNTTTTIVNNTGFWRVDLTFFTEIGVTARNATVNITDGLSSKVIWEANTVSSGNAGTINLTDNSFVAFLRSGDSLTASTNDANAILDVWYRQVADVNGTLVNPLGFTFS